MELKKLTQFAGTLAVSLALSTAASAGVVWMEQAPGAGDRIDTAQVTLDSGLNSLTGIQGSLRAVVPVGGSPVFEVDIYKIRVDGSVPFSARTESGNPVDDTSLFLFDSAGQGVYMNDDNGVDLLSALTDRPLAIGFYYIAIALGGTEAFSDGASTLASFLAGSFSDVREGDPGAGPLQSWSSMFAAGTESAFGYSIVLTGATVADLPEPTTLALALFMVAGFAARSRAGSGRRS